MLVVRVNRTADVGIQYLPKAVNKTFPSLTKRVGLTIRTKLLRYKVASSHPTLMWGSPTSQKSIVTDQRMSEMEDVTRNLKSQSRDSSTSRPDKSEIMYVLYQHGSTDVFSLEWVTDRFSRQFVGRN